MDKNKSVDKQVPAMTFIFYKDKKHEYRWKILHKNGKILADSGEGYKTKSGIKKSADNIIKRINTGNYNYNFFNINK